MNKLVIIGNGFDLAHGLPTSYGDFINWYWKKVIEHFSECVEKVYSDEICYVELTFKSKSLITISKSKERFKEVQNFYDLNSFVVNENIYLSTYEEDDYEVSKNTMFL
jgi:hypothetical protein